MIKEWIFVKLSEKKKTKLNYYVQFERKVFYDISENKA